MGVQPLNVFARTVDDSDMAPICELFEAAEDARRAARAAEGALKRGDHSTAEALLDRVDSLIDLASAGNWHEDEMESPLSLAA